MNVIAATSIALQCIVVGPSQTILPLVIEKDSAQEVSIYSVANYVWPFSREKVVLTSNKNKRDEIFYIGEVDGYDIKMDSIHDGQLIIFSKQGVRILTGSCRKFTTANTKNIDWGFILKTSDGILTADQIENKAIKSSRDCIVSSANGWTSRFHYDFFSEKNKVIITTKDRKLWSNRVIRSDVLPAAPFRSKTLVNTAGLPKTDNQISSLNDLFVYYNADTKDVSTEVHFFASKNQTTNLTEVVAGICSEFIEKDLKK